MASSHLRVLRWGWGEHMGCKHNTKRVVCWGKGRVRLSKEQEITMTYLYTCTLPQYAQRVY